MGSARVKTSSVSAGAGFFPSTVCKSLFFLFFGLAAQSHGTPAMFACMHVCMYVWMYACMYVSVLVCMYLLKFGYVLEHSDNRNIL